MHRSSYVASKSCGARRPHRRHALLLAQLGVLVLVALTTALTYDPRTGQYTDITSTPMLTPGQGAWVYVASDASLSLG